MKVLVIGSGGREHALCWKLKQSPLLSELFCLPGNAGTALVAQNISGKVEDIESISNAVRQREIDLVIVGPELPLSLGLVDALAKERCLVFGPNRAAAEIEESKHFAKEVMQAAGISTAPYKTLTSEQSALAYVKEQSLPVVIKADGLASGKGVFICKDLGEAEEALAAVFGALKSDRVLIEEYMQGVEASYIVVTDGERVVPLASSHDYKRLYDGQEGPNTGGMGTVSPTSHLSTAQEEWVLENIMTPTIRELKQMGRPFCGFLYAGLMIEEGRDPRVVEFNARLGDPETQVILRRMDSDLLALLVQLLDKDSTLEQPVWNRKTALCVVLAAAGYPEKPEKGVTINLPASNLEESIEIFHAGTALDDSGALLSAGGRVLNVTSLEEDVSAARDRVYEACEKIVFPGSHYRKDIGR